MCVALLQYPPGGDRLCDSPPELPAPGREGGNKAQQVLPPGTEQGRVRLAAGGAGRRPGDLQLWGLPRAGTGTAPCITPGPSPWPRGSPCGSGSSPQAPQQPSEGDCLAGPGPGRGGLSVPLREPGSCVVLASLPRAGGLGMTVPGRVWSRSCTGRTAAAAIAPLGRGTSPAAPRAAPPLSSHRWAVPWQHRPLG